jgi:hypothetical protein
MVRLAVALVGPLLVGALCGCGATEVQQQTAAGRAAACSGKQDGFAASLAVSRGGQTSPIEAAQSFGLPMGWAVSVSKDGWRLLDSVSGEARLQSGDVVLHAIQVDDGTWFIDSGKRYS